jgi:hypothetical protein
MGAAISKADLGGMNHNGCARDQQDGAPMSRVRLKSPALATEASVRCGQRVQTADLDVEYRASESQARAA